MRSSVLVRDLEYEFEYLGSKITQDCTLDREISKCICKTSHTFGSLYRVLWSRRKIKMFTKMHQFKGVVIAILLYGSETWLPSMPQLEVAAFIMWCRRVTLGVTRWDQKWSTELCAMAGIERVEILVMMRRLQWLGHLERLDGTRFPKRLLMCCPVAGGQKRRWNDLILHDLKICGLLPEWHEVAHEWGAWRRLVHEALSELNMHQVEQEVKIKTS